MSPTRSFRNARTRGLPPRRMRSPSFTHYEDVARVALVAAPRPRATCAPDLATGLRMSVDAAAIRANLGAVVAGCGEGGARRDWERGREPPHVHERAYRRGPCARLAGEPGEDGAVRHELRREERVLPPSPARDHRLPRDRPRQEHRRGGRAALSLHVLRGQA